MTQAPRLFCTVFLLAAGLLALANPADTTFHPEPLARAKHDPGSFQREPLARANQDPGPAEPAPVGLANHDQTTFHPEPRDSVSRLADTYMQKLTALGRFNGVVLLRKDGEVLLRKAYNMEPEGPMEHLHVTLDSRFDLRSVAKLFARLAVLQLEKDGKLSTRDPIGRYLPGFPNGDRITIRHLMDHASGLPREFVGSAENTLALTPEQVVALAAAQPLEFEPGEKSQYSNVGFQLLYYIIGQLSGGSFSGYLKEQVFVPLGMEATGGNFDPGMRFEHYAYGHYRDRDGALQCEAAFPPDDMQMGNLHSTADDMDRFLASLQPGVHDALLEDGVVAHAGGTRGKRAYVERSFQGDYSMVFLANYDGIPFEQVVSDLRKLLTGKPVKMPEQVHRTAVRVAPEILSRYTGTYDFVEAGHLLLTLKLEQDSLRVYQKGTYNGALYPESETVFFGDPESAESLEFIPGEQGGHHILMDFQGVQWKGVRIADPD